MMVGADLGIMDMDTATINTSITNINIIGTDTVSIYIAPGNVGFRICAAEGRQLLIYCPEQPIGLQSCLSLATGGPGNQ